MEQEPPDGNVWQVIRERRSIRRYTDEPVPRALLERVLDAARWAPSAHNRQPWRFCVVIDGALKRRLGRALGERWRADGLADGTPAEEIERRAAVSFGRLTGASALVVASLSMDEMDSYPDARRSAAEWTMGVQSVALACQNLLLAAHAEGLGSCWMCAPLFAPDTVREVLSLPASWHPQALITLGRPAEARQKERKPLADFVLWK